MTDVLGIPGADETVLVLWRSASTELVHAKPLSLAGKSRLEGLVEVMLEFSTEYDFPFRPVRIECNDRELARGLINWKRITKSLTLWTVVSMKMNFLKSRG